MNEVRRFLRYTLPGLASVLMLLILLSITDCSSIYEWFSVKDTAQGLGLVLSIFLGSGALGYLFANVYFSLYWTWPFSSALAIDHRPLFSNLRGEIKVIDYSGNEYERFSPSKRIAWTIVTQFWFYHIEKSEEIKGVDGYIDRLTDITHGLGATFIGLICAFAAWFFIHSKSLHGAACWKSPETIVVVSWLILMALLVLGYRRTQMALQSIVNSTMTAFIRQQFKSKGRPSEIHYVE
jgi:hypothetical protein